MEQVFLLAVIITVIYCISKFVEYKYFSGENNGLFPPMKEVVRDVLLVLVACLTGGYIFFYFHHSISDFMNVVTETKVLNPATTQIFTDAPAF